MARRAGHRSSSHRYTAWGTPESGLRPPPTADRWSAPLPDEQHRRAAVKMVQLPAAAFCADCTWRTREETLLDPQVGWVESDHVPMSDGVNACVWLPDIFSGEYRLLCHLNAWRVIRSTALNHDAGARLVIQAANHEEHTGHRTFLTAGQPENARRRYRHRDPNSTIKVWTWESGDNGDGRWVPMGGDQS